MSELRPCPFCGSDKLNVGYIRATASLSYWSVECTKCGVEIGDDESEDAVVTHWNTRAAALPAGDDGELERAAKVVADEIAHLRFGTRKTDTPERQARRLRRFEAALKSMEQAADRIAALNAEVARLARSVKANNDLARMYKAQADEFRAKYVAVVGSSIHD